jgi:basic membrane protein A
MRKSKLAFAIVAFTSVLVLSGCGSEDDVTLKIALATDSGTINDHSFNESAWKAVNEFAIEQGGTDLGNLMSAIETGPVRTKYVGPNSANADYTTQDRIAEVETLIEDWAPDVIVLPGYLFQGPIKYFVDHPETFGNTTFLAIDCVAQDDDYNDYTYTDNVTSVIFREEQAGFLAGYAAVIDGYRKLGFVGGMAVPAVVRYGSGYVQGADYAATELGLGTGSITIPYYYAGVFGPTDAATALCKEWYNEDKDAEIIFGCGGSVYQSILTAGSFYGGKPWIGVDVNQHAGIDASDTNSCVTSAMKNITGVTEDLLNSWIDNDKAWSEDVAAQVKTMGVESDACGLPTPEETGDEGCWGFENFTVEEYEEVYAKLKNGTIVVNDSSDDATLKENNYNASDKVVVNVVE